MPQLQDPRELLKLFFLRLKTRIRDQIVMRRGNDFFNEVKGFVNNCIYRAEFFFQRFGKRIMRTIDTLTILLSLWCIGNVVWQIGFISSEESMMMMVASNRFAIGFFGLVAIVKFSQYIGNGFRSIPPSEILYAVLTWLYIYLSRDETFTYHALFNHQYFVNAAAVLISITEISRLGISVLSRKTSPTLLFISSFVLIIAIGTGLLLMPRCHDVPVSFVEALFTATSSVCVTGLSVVDLTHTFNHFGMCIILILVQIGGLGVMTFTCFFALSLNGRSSIQNQIVIRDLVSVENMTDIFSTLKRILYVTVIVELASAWVIYWRLVRMNPDIAHDDLLFTAVFHAISAFCNAGISNLDGGLTNDIMAGNRLLQLTIAFTAFFGGMGFPLQSSAIDWTKHKLHGIVRRLRGKSHDGFFRARMVNVSSRLMFFVHMALLVVGMTFFFFTESSFSQSGESLFGRLSDSFLLSVVTRSSGFGAFDMSSLNPITLLIIAGLMWVGCAPLSTGGGVKVTTFALVLLNLRNALIRKENIEVFGRRISGQSIRRAFATVVVSIGAIMASTIILKILNPAVPLTVLMFDSNAALSTAGLTLGNAADLTLGSQLILISDMFVGRIGVLAFLTCFFRTSEKQYYQYPTENIMI